MSTTAEQITSEKMRAKLHPLSYVREALARTEPLATYAFSVGKEVRFRIQPGWHHGVEAKDGHELVDAYLRIGSGSAGNEFRLTKDSLLEATSLCGLGKGYASRCPAELVEPHLNYWFREGLGGRPIRDFQLLVAGDAGAAITRASIQPFSNVRLVDQALAGIAAKYGESEVLVDYKFSHSLRRTHVRLIVPEQQRVIQRTGTAADAWSLGIQLNNSLIGAESTSISGYLFRWFCTNGATDTMATSGVYSRRGAGREQEVYEWARAAVDDVLGGLEPALDNVQAMVDIPIEGEANQVLRDVFQHYRTPLPERARIIERMVEAGELTMYSVMAAITEVANDPSMSPAHVDGLLRMGGDLPHAATSRCTACRRLLPH